MTDLQRQRDALNTIKYLDGILLRYAEGREELAKKDPGWYAARLDDLLDRRLTNMRRCGG